MITPCLELLSRTEIYYSWVLLLSHLWLIISDLYSAANDPQAGNDPQIGLQITANDPR